MQSMAFQRTLDGVTHADARTRVEAALKENGFGVITEIDVRSTIKEKLGKDFRNYSILGACNPEIAHRALEQRPEIGLLLPCNVVVTENETGSSEVWIADPAAMIQFVPDAAGLEGLMEEARQRLRRTIESL
ncbi:MAG: DUF302 domain-containing protein [Candidatus Eisenbacteria bacterium]|uniref:DUF302 domain-containing protein n=1 Tax=Eiseniibacteriota bacterium TaxID=2212470 RepID=A0A956NHC6_UNCEI|nr:DUF302 domain-containing protein [Candidatus Eisenbacteria bacterium]